MVIMTTVWMLLGTVTTEAQFVDLGQDPARTRWRQIRTEDFEIIYPDFFEERAQYMANLYAALYAHANTLGIRPGRMAMVVRANGGVSNGNAGWAPKKSELYTAPSQDAVGSWLEHLCVHEFRHVVQYEKVNRGFTRALYTIFGEQATMAVVGLFLPMWWLEGDATVFETSVNPGQRGRSPEFLNELKAQVTERGIYSYYKAVLGSYKDFVPDRYTLGYYLVGNSRRHYGPGIWTEAADRAGRRPYTLAPFARSLRMTLEAGRDSVWAGPRFRSLFVNPDSVKRANRHRDAKVTLYRDNLVELQQVWRREAEATRNDFDTTRTGTNRVYTNYHYPTPMGGGRVVAYKEGLDEAGVFVMLEGGREREIFRPGTLYDYKFAWKDGMLVWSEYRPHPRWEHGGKMVIATYDTRTGEYRRHGSGANRYAPFAAGDGWGFVEVDREGRASLVLTDATLERETARVTARVDEQLVHPAWDGQGRIVAVVVSREGNRLERIDPRDGSRQPLTELTYREVDNPAVDGDRVYFRASTGGNNALYALDTRTGETRLVSVSRFGSRYPTLAPGGDTLHFAFYTAAGYRPGRVALDGKSPVIAASGETGMIAGIVPGSTPGDGARATAGDGIRQPARMAADGRGWPARPETDTTLFPIAGEVARQEGWAGFPARDSVYESRRYSKLLHLLNIHSWGPIYPDADETSVDIGLAVSSQNKLSTLYFTAGYVVGKGYENGCWQAKATYRGWWPTVQLKVESGKNDWSLGHSDPNALNRVTGDRDTVYAYYDSRTTKGTATVQLPLNLNRRDRLRQLTPLVQYELQSIHDLRLNAFYRVTGSAGDVLVGSPANPGDYTYSGRESIRLQILKYALIYNNQTRMSQRDLYPRWGQRLEAGYEHTPFGSMDYGTAWWADAQLYLPGAARHHALLVYGGYQQMSRNGYYGNQIHSPRGMSLHGEKLAVTRVGYYLPVAYPDAHIGSLVYMKRVAAGAFFDAGRIESGSYRDTRCSFGIEATVEGNVLCRPFPVKAGFRAGYETQHRKMFGELLLSVNFTI